MSAFEELLLALAILYAFACCAWLRREAVVLRAGVTRRFRAQTGAHFLGSDVAGACVLTPWPPLGRAFVTWLPIVSLDERGVVTAAAFSHNPGERVPRAARFFAWEALAKLTVDGVRVLASGKEVLRAGSPGHARHLARVLAGVRDAGAGAREREIERFTATGLDHERAASRAAEFERATRVLRVLCNGELALLALVLPAIGFTAGLDSMWLPLVGALALVHVAVLVLAARSHARLYPKERGERAVFVVSIAILPTGAVRVLDALARDLVCDLHPLAAARALLTDDDFAGFAERTLRDARAPVDAMLHAEHAEIVEASRARTVAALESFARAHGVARERWAGPPARLAPDCVAYCPRCLRQPTHTDGECAACLGVEMRSFDG